MADARTCTKCGEAPAITNSDFCQGCISEARLEKKRQYAVKKRLEFGLSVLGGDFPCELCSTATPRLNNGQKYCPACSASEKKRLEAIGRQRRKGKTKRTVEQPEVVRARQRAWVKQNPEKVRASRLKHDAVRLSSPRWRMENAVRCGIRRGIRPGSKGDMRTFEAVGFSPEQLRKHLELQFLPGMSWENYGAWHVDHRLPLS